MGRVWGGGRQGAAGAQKIGRRFFFFPWRAVRCPSASHQRPPCPARARQGTRPPGGAGQGAPAAVRGGPGSPGRAPGARPAPLRQAACPRSPGFLPPPPRRSSPAPFFVLLLPSPQAWPRAHASPARPGRVPCRQEAVVVRGRGGDRAPPPFPAAQPCFFCALSALGGPSASARGPKPTSCVFFTTPPR